MARKYEVKTNKKRNIPELNRVWFHVLHATAGVPASQVVARMKKGYQIAPSTLRNLRNGKTIYPTLKTAFLIARAMGKPLTFGQETTTVSRPRPIKIPKSAKKMSLKLIQGGIQKAA